VPSELNLDLFYRISSKSELSSTTIWNSGVKKNSKNKSRKDFLSVGSRKEGFLECSWYTKLNLGIHFGEIKFRINQFSSRIRIEKSVISLKQKSSEVFA
jgi:hypothetical protein